MATRSRDADVLRAPPPFPRAGAGLFLSFLTMEGFDLIGLSCVGKGMRSLDRALPPKSGFCCAGPDLGLHARGDFGQEPFFGLRLPLWEGGTLLSAAWTERSLCTCYPSSRCGCSQNGQAASPRDSLGRGR